MFTLSLEDLNKHLLQDDPEEGSHRVAPTEKPKTVIPNKLKDFANIFLPKEAKCLPPHCPYDHNIKLHEEKTLPFGPLYTIS